MQNETWEKLNLIKVFFMKELCEFKDLLKENYAFMVFEGEVTNEISAPAQRAINIIASPYGVLSQEIFLNSHAPGFLALVLTEKIALIQTRVIEGIEGGLVLMPEKAILLPSKLQGFGISVIAPKL
ncbi:unnamed protein product [Blepharisma stoltei]|uniref:Uncharacterized protein n=1 Tax=Blepharisma stoltei TaxID=1481888 RepID=A0AAU9JFT6_9CILI|nr:unnamed protein product [Blepharisma stoltei]